MVLTSRNLFVECQTLKEPLPLLMSRWLDTFEEEIMERIEKEAQNSIPTIPVESQTQVAEVDDHQLVAGHEAAEQKETEPVMCPKCQLPINAENSVAKYIAKGDSSQSSFLCKSCHSTDVMCSRHFSEMPSGWNNLSDEEQVSFYRRVLAEKQRGPLRFKVLRTELKDTLVKKKIEETRKGSKGKFEPLETYRLRGYDIEKIQELAEMETHPILGPTYRVDINHVCTESIEQTVEEAINAVDRKVLREKLPEHMIPKPKPKPAPTKKGRGKGKGEPEEHNEDEKKEEAVEEAVEIPPDPIFVDLMDMDSCSDAEIQAPRFV